VSTRKQPTASDLIRDINDRLDGLEAIMAWTIPASSRFKVGDRVEFNACADRRTITHRKKSRTGVVLDMRGPSVRVHLEGYATPSWFSHAFFDKSTKRKAPTPRPRRKTR
jgi:hypothetical protein